jgi:hypothetical protein
MSQERLNRLAILSIKQDLLENIEYPPPPGVPRGFPTIVYPFIVIFFVKLQITLSSYL